MQPEPEGDVAVEAQLRVFCYAPAFPFHFTRYETKQTKPLPSPAKRINKPDKILVMKKEAALGGWLIPECETFKSFIPWVK
jgi:hypothetical protein